MAAIDPIPVEIKFWPPEGGEAAPMVPSSRREARRRCRSRRRTRQLCPRRIRERAGTISALLSLPFVHADYETVTSLEALDRWIGAAYERGYIAVDTETDSLDSMQANLVGVSLATAPGKACYVPLTHKARAAVSSAVKSSKARSPRRCHREAEAPAGRPLHSQDRPEPQV